MNYLIPLAIILFINTGKCQTSKSSIEISLLGRYDKHGEYDSRYSYRVRVDHTKLYGFSPGINITYRKKTKQDVFLKAG